MKKILIALFASFALITEAQEISVEKSLFSVQTGLMGIWVQHEARLSNTIALRSEVGFDSGFGVVGSNSYYDSKTQTFGSKFVFLMAPVLTVEPRFYYNLKSRNAKLKRIDNNSGNFLSLHTNFHPDWFVISNDKDVFVRSDLSVIPTWGIRRNIGQHFNYEAGGGIGYKYLFSQKGYSASGGVAFNIHLRIGYTF